MKSEIVCHGKHRSDHRYGTECMVPLYDNSKRFGFVHGVHLHIIVHTVSFLWLYTFLVPVVERI